jgi:glycerol uptake facilitator protein
LGSGRFSFAAHEEIGAKPHASFHWNQLIPVYVLPGLVGSALAAFAYDFMTKPRVVETPIREAVSHPDDFGHPAQTAATP